MNHTRTAEAGQAALEAFDEGPWGRRYPVIAQSWRRHWTEVIPFYAFPAEVRRIIDTTNAIEALHAKLRRAVRARGHFPTDDAVLKLLFLVLNLAEGVEDAREGVDRRQGPVHHPLRGPLRHHLINAVPHEISDTPASPAPHGRLPRSEVLRGTDGTLLTVKAGLEVRNVAQIRAGNQVVIRYVEALAARLAPSYPTASRSALGSASPPPRLPR